jgi:RNA-binding protein
MHTKEKKLLKAKAHILNPVVYIGNNGLTSSVIAAIEQALLDHELIKIKISLDKEEHPDIIEQICSQLSAEMIQHIGKVLIIYRENPEKKSHPLS